MFKSNPLKQFVFELRSIDVTQNLRLSLNRSICVLVRQSRGSASSQTTTNMYFAFPHYRGSYIRTTDRCSRRRGEGMGLWTSSYLDLHRISLLRQDLTNTPLCLSYMLWCGDIKNITLFAMNKFII